MKRRFLFTAAMIILAVSLAVGMGGCKKSEEEVEKKARPQIKKGEEIEHMSKEDRNKYEDSMQKLKDVSSAMEKIKEREPVDPVNFRELLPFIPESIGKYKRDGEPTGESANMAGMKISHVEAYYLPPGGEPRIGVEVIDLAYIPHLYITWNMAGMIEVDSTEELRKNSTVEGFKSIEMYQYKDKNGQLSILVAERFQVQIKAKGFDNLDPLKDFAKEMELKQLEELVKEKHT